MEEQEVVKDPEQTDVVDSTPTEEKTIEPVEAPEVVEAETEKVDAVPYDRFKAVNDQKKALEQELEALRTPAQKVETPASMDNTFFDEDTQQGLDTWYVQRREAEKSAEFQRKHASDLADPVLSGTVIRVIQEANAKGQTVDQEDALNIAKKLLDDRVAPRVQQAKTDGVSEGQDIARQKEQASAIGETASKQEVDIESLPAEEYAKALGLKKV